MFQQQQTIQTDPTLLTLGQPGLFTDTITSIDAFAIDNSSYCFGVSSWDCSMRVFVVSPSPQGTAQVNQVCEQKLGEPITTLCTAGQYFAFGTASGKMGLWDVRENQLMVLHEFQDAVTSLKFSPELKSIIVTSLDGSLMLLDVSSSQKTTLTTGVKINCMDTHTEFIGYSSPGQVEIFNVYAGKNVTNDLLTTQQSRTNCSIQAMSFFADKKGIINCGSNGKADVVHFERKDSQYTFTFKAVHKKLSQVQSIFYPVNDISFYNDSTFLTAGSDGIIRIWNKSTKSIVNQLNSPDKKASITTAKFLCNSNFLAFSTGNDYHTGYSSLGNNVQSIPFVKILQNDEILKTMSFRSKK